MRRYVIYHYVHNEMSNGDVLSHRESLCAFATYADAETWMNNHGTFNHEIAVIDTNGYYNYIRKEEDEDFGEEWDFG